MAARPKPHEHGGRGGNEGQHADGAGTRMEFKCGAHDERGSATTQPIGLRQPANSLADRVEAGAQSVLQPASIEPEPVL